MVALKDYFTSQIDAKLAEAAEIAEDTTKNSPTLSAEEKTAKKARVEKLLEEVEGLKSQVKDLDDAEGLKNRINAMRPQMPEAPEEAKGATSDIGSAFTGSENYKALLQAGMHGDWKSGAIEIPHWRGGMKTNVTEALSAIVQPDVVPGIVPILNWPLRVADLFAQNATTGNSVRFIEELANTNAAAGVSEAALKPESAITFDQKDMPVGKIATFLPVSDEMLEDVQQIQSYLNSRLSTFVQIEEDSELLNGAGSPSVTGVLQNGSILTGSALSLDTDSVIDSIFQAMTVVKKTSFLNVDGIVVNPTDWAAIRLMKDNNKQYYGGGPFTGAYGGGGGIAGDNLWGIPVVVTTSIAVGTILLGAFKLGGGVFRRNGLTVEASNSHSDFFQRNLTAIRAEERLALVIYRPSAFYKLTGANQLEGS